MKCSLRKQMKATLASMPAAAVAAKSGAACNALMALPEFRRAGVVMLYLSICGEVDTAPIALGAWQAGKTVLAPKMLWQSRRMLAVEIHSLETNLVTADFGLREPAEGQPRPASEIDFIVVPALAYDRKGNRLGRGGGIYDRFLASPGLRAVTCGLAFAEQVGVEVPVCDHDRPVDLLVSDAEVLRFRNAEPTDL
ncbi:MAG: 5-formyltetrahydrofolate cyclo-ligase [Planctomycetota bacterium]|nr:5-formyltetrahydrofolate cyclo-ligase [Planctomycetota bacterium]